MTGTYPTMAQGLSALTARPAIEPKPETWRKLLENERGTIDPWGNKYVYKHPGERNPESFDLFSMGEDGKAGTSDDIWPK